MMDPQSGGMIADSPDWEDVLFWRVLEWDGTPTRRKIYCPMLSEHTVKDAYQYAELMFFFLNSGHKTLASRLLGAIENWF